MDKDRAEVASLLGVFLFDAQGTPTETDIREFVEHLTDEQVRRYFVALLFDATRGLRPAQKRVQA